MNTFLDLLLVVVMALIAVGVLAVGLMFLVKNEKIRNIAFWIISILGIYVGYAGVRIMRFGFPFETFVAVLMALVSAGSIVLTLYAKKDKKKLLTARIMASIAFAIGTVNAFML